MSTRSLQLLGIPCYGGTSQVRRTGCAAHIVLSKAMPPSSAGMATTTAVHGCESPLPPQTLGLAALRAANSAWFVVRCGRLIVVAEEEKTHNEISAAVRGAVQARSVGDVYQGGVHVHPAEPVRWPCRVGVVPVQADCFQQRDIGSALADAIGAGETAVLTQVLAGLGGVGKTQLAAEYARDRWAAGDVDLLVWITASSREAILSGYANAAAKVGLTDTEGEEDRAGQRFMEWLDETERRWLIVLDDVQEPQLGVLWPPERSTGRVVVTTRRQDAALSGKNRRLIDVGLFTPAEASQYLQAKLAARPDLVEGADDLVADLGYLPLALAQAAAYLVDRNLTCADYRLRLADRRRGLAELVPEDGSLPDDHRTTVAAAWSLSVEWADQLTPTNLALPLLELAALLDPNGIPADLFTTATVLTHLAGVTEWARVEPDQATDALQNLRRLSLASIDHADAHHAVQVHALVQRATRESLVEDRLVALANTAADALMQIWPDIERDTVLCRALRANTDNLRTNTGTSLLHSTGRAVLYRAGSSLENAGLVTAALSYFHDLFTQSHRELGPTDTSTLTARHNLARLRGDAGDAAGAVEALETLLDDLLHVLPTDHLHTLTIRNDLASFRSETGDTAGAVAAFETLHDDLLRVLGPDHPNTLTAREHLAALLEQIGDTSGAVAAFHKLFDDRLRVLGPDDPSTLSTRRRLAIFRGDAGDVPGAVAALETLLDDLLRVLGPDHLQTLEARGNLGNWRGRTGDVVGAAAALETLLDDRIRLLGSDHPKSLQTRYDLAHWTMMM